MPATTSLVVTREERFQQRVGEVAAYFTLSCVLLFALAPAAGVIYWLATDFTVQDRPQECFDVVQGCEIIDVQPNGPSSPKPNVCEYRFTYIWTSARSLVTYQQGETLSIDAASCPPLEAGAVNATFQVGLTACFTVQERFSAYADAFNCASVASGVESNVSSSGEPCETLLSPTSDHSVSLAVFCAFGVAAMYCLCFCPSRGEDLEL